MGSGETAMAQEHAAGMVPIYSARTGQVENRRRIRRSDAEWRRILPPETYRVACRKGTEPPFANRYNDFHEKGIYHCAVCGIDLFRSDTKFESGTGWPSFWAPVSELNVRTEEDLSGGMRRIEVRCALCGAHLGHVFDDGPPPTGKRYCMNSASLRFVPEKAP
ncbi:MAG: peptide-methionine (R)-S-oxide reductase MsrB [Methanomicrobiales archaeon]|nr:peptide-methionine (R)-S-oxide reductase MsrB [Methanomicrobiales archaeon]